MSSGSASGGSTRGVVCNPPSLFCKKGQQRRQNAPVSIYKFIFYLGGGRGPSPATPLLQTWTRIRALAWAWDPHPDYKLMS